MRTHDEDPVSQINRLFHVMRNKENCTRGFIPDLQQKLLHVTAGLGIKRAERLIHEDYRGAQRESASDGDALLHPTGKRFRVYVGKLTQTDGLQKAVDRLFALGFRDSVDLHAVGNVVRYSKPGE